MTACGNKVRPALGVALPASLVADCEETKGKLDAAEAAMSADQPAPVITNGDLVLKIRSLRADLKRCNADKAGLRALGPGIARG